MERRVEIFMLTKSKSKGDWSSLFDMCHKAKNLYNAANYVLRQLAADRLDNVPEYTDLIHTETKRYKSEKTGEMVECKQNFISEFDLSKRMCQLRQPDYRAMKAQCSQQVIKQVFKAHKLFYRSIADYYKNPEKYDGKPRLPRYKDKKGTNAITFTNQSCSITKDGRLKLSKDCVLESVVTNLKNCDLCEVRIVPRLDDFKIEIVYKVKDEGEYAKKSKQRNTRRYTAAVDIGVDNLMAITTDNVDSTPLLVNGRPLKSMNQYYNRKLSEMKSELSRHGLKTSRRLRRLCRKRDLKIDDFMHKASRRIVDWCILNNVSKLYVGHNDGWKQECNMSKTNNQNFVMIPFDSLFRKLEYKLHDVGIEFELVKESYTSKCSFLDSEEIGPHDNYCGKRVKRGLFRSSDGYLLNADINGSLNILTNGMGHAIRHSKKIFNPITVNNINELNDVCFFNFKEYRESDQLIQALC